MKTVATVQRISSTGTRKVRDLGPGESVTFGVCGCGACGFDLPAEARAGGQAAGRVIAFADHWRLVNLSQGARLVVEDLENAHHLITVPAARFQTVVPFELARISAAGVAMATVYGPEPVAQPEPVAACPAIVSTGPPHGLDQETTYFVVLTALCAPRLKGLVDAPLPTSIEVSAVLARRGLTVTPFAVDAQIAYLVQKLGLRPEEDAGRPKRSWRKEALVSFAIRHGLVSPEQLPV